MKNRLSNEILDFSLSRAGVLISGYYGAYFKIKTDVRSIFPYMNASLKEAKYFENPDYIQFYLEDVKCTLYPNELIAASFLNSTTALAFFNRFVNFVNDLYHRQDEIKPDYRRFHPPSVTDILKLLPRSNCKACGYSTCVLFAVALQNGETTPDKCPGFARPIYIRKVYPVFDVSGNLLSSVTIDIDTLEDISEPKTPKQSPTSEKPFSQSAETANCALSEDPPEITLDNNTAEEMRNSNIKIGTPPLTQREIQVLRLITAGSTNTEIAGKLGISPHTVKSHVVHIFNKLGVNDRTQAAVWATRYRLEIVP